MSAFFLVLGFLLGGWSLVIYARGNADRAKAGLGYSAGSISIGLLWLILAGANSTDRVPGQQDSDSTPKSDKLAIARPKERPVLNKAWSTDPYGMNSSTSGFFDEIALSPSGYPIVVVLQEQAVCSSAFRVKEATDAMNANRPDWAAAIPGCVVVPKGFQAEWISKRAIEGVSEFRFDVPRSARPLTMYGKSISNHVDDWAALVKR